MQEMTRKERNRGSTTCRVHNRGTHTEGMTQREHHVQEKSRRGTCREPHAKSHKEGRSHTEKNDRQGSVTEGTSQRERHKGIITWREPHAQNISHKEHQGRELHRESVTKGASPISMILRAAQRGPHGGNITLGVTHRELHAGSRKE